MVLEIGPRVLHMLGKYFNTGLHTQILKEKDTLNHHCLDYDDKEDIWSISIGSINIHSLRGTVFRELGRRLHG